MTARARPSQAFAGLILPLIKRLALRRVRRKVRKVEHLGRRMGLLQMGGSVPLFESLPGLADMATGGLGLKRALEAIERTVESGANVNWNRVADALDQVDPFLKDAHRLLDHYDSGRKREDRLFVVRKSVKGLF